ncbi:MAG TPA: ABC transporter permease, partial [Capillimicrobium sp.]
PSDDREIELRQLDSRAAAETALRDDDVDVAVVDGRDLLFGDEVDDGLAGLLQEASARTRAAEALRADGVSAERVQAALDPPPLGVATVEEASDDSQEGVAFIVVLILFGQLITYGMAVATGVVEEKTSRIVEVLLATIRPWQLLAGKIAGIGLLGLVQIVLVTVLGGIAALAAGAIDVSGDVLEAIAVALAWYVLGYLLYACLFAVTGAIVPRQEELQSAAAPLTLAITVSYFIGFTALQSPDGLLATIASYVPLSSPLVMPPLIIAGHVGALEVAASVAVLLASIAVLIPLAARLYAGSVLQLRRRVSLRQAWRAAEQDRTAAG